jgi:hypothetical protein
MLKEAADAEIIEFGEPRQNAILERLVPHKNDHPETQRVTCKDSIQLYQWMQNHRVSRLVTVGGSDQECDDQRCGFRYTWYLAYCY